MSAVKLIGMKEKISVKELIEEMRTEFEEEQNNKVTLPQIKKCVPRGHYLPCGIAKNLSEKTLKAYKSSCTPRRKHKKTLRVRAKKAKRARK